MNYTVQYNTKKKSTEVQYSILVLTLEERDS